MSDRVALASERWAVHRGTNALLAADPGAAAREVNDALARRAPMAGRLFSVKDVYASAGMTSTAGSLLLEGYVPSDDAVAVARLRAAGAALFGKGNCAEFGFGVAGSANRIGGTVEHPVDPRLAVGGSSGGDAVAVATGIVDVALAGDYGGSVRWPAQALGICGLRTGVGTVPRTGRIPGCGASPSNPVAGPPDPWSLAGMLETVGILARSVDGIADAVEAVAGPDGDDWWGLGGPPLARRPLRGRLAFSLAPEVGAVAGEVSEAVRVTRAAAASAGFEVIDVSGLFTGAFETYQALRAALDAHEDLRRLSAGREDLLCAETVSALGAVAGDGSGDAGTSARWAVARAATRRVVRLLGEVDALVVPLAPSGPALAGQPVRIDGRPLSDAESMAHCRAVSLTGLPALSVPVMGQGRTVSVQIVGPPWGELQCCQVASAIGRVLSRGWAAPIAGSAP